MNELVNGECFVVKIGTTSVLMNNRKLDDIVLTHLAADIGNLWHHEGKRFAVVTSGARELGRLSPDDDPRTAASRGMPQLMRVYTHLFENQEIHVGQLLVETNHFDVMKDDPETGVANAISRAWRDNTITIVNENDPLATKVTTLGDNDALASKVGIALKESGHNVGGVIFMSVENGNGAMGRGGGEAKAQAIKSLEREGVPALVVPGKKPHAVGSLFAADGVDLKTALMESARVREVQGRKAVRA